MKKVYCPLLASFFANVLFFNSTSAQIQMVKDINPIPSVQYSNPSKFITINGTTFFSAYNVDYGYELWKTDGTTSGTAMVMDISSGSGSSNPGNLTNVNGSLFFSAASGGVGTELWKSDGTEEGTEMVKDIYPSGFSSSPQQLTVLGSTVFFQANDGTNGVELWKSNGTDAGTVLVKDIYSGSSGSFPSYFTSNGSILFFQANDGTNGYELWKTDGTSLGTVMIKDIYTGASSSSPYKFVAFGSTVLFRATDAAGGSELWKSNGTTIGTSLVKDIWSGASSSAPDYLTANGTSLFFSANEGTNGIELWKSDPPYNSASTAMVMDIYPGVTSSSPQYITNVNGILYFTASDGVNGIELWLSGGDVSNTGMVKDIYAGASFSSPNNLTAFGSVLYFSANESTGGQELWRSDGTTGGTVQVKDIEAGIGSSSPNYIYSSGTYLILAATTTVNGTEPWISDGTSGGTNMLLNINPEIGASNPYYITNVNDTVYFFANDGVNGIELWKSDGTSGGTVMLKDIYAGVNSSYSGSSDGIININGTLFFIAQDGINGVELWKSNRTTGGTVMVKDIWPGASSSTPNHFMNVNGTLFFWANDGVNGAELWKSDSPYNAASTSLVKDIYSGVSSSTPSGSFIGSTVSFNNLLYFQANDGINGNELWQSDGTTGGTILVKDINSGINSGLPNGLTVSNGKLFFYATDVNGVELWISDGTTVGTVLLKDINPGTASSSPINFFDDNGILLFGANDGSGSELWKSDGTLSGTIMIKNIFPGVTSTSISGFTNTASTLYFRGKDGTAGLELWKTDGTTGGTVLIKDYNPGFNASVPSSLINFHDTLFYTSRNLIYGTELCVSNGTVLTTALAADIYPGVGSSGPLFLAKTSNTIFFSASDSTNGRELWKLTMPPALARTVSTTNVICTGGSNGSIDLSVSGGNQPYTYLWSNAATTEDISGLTAGTYSVVITDSWGWQKTNTIVVSQPSPTIISISSQSNVSCSGGSDGTINLSITGGGTAPYTYLWSPGNATTQNISGLTANNYSVLVTDALGCTNTFSAIVTQPLPIAASTSVTNTSCNAGSDGTATVYASDGIPPYSYSWNTSPAQTTQTATGLIAGSYSVTVTDANGCTGKFSASISQPPAFFTNVITADENCSGGSNGGANLFVGGATPPYTYLWSNGATTQDITNVTASSYTVTITDNNGCTKSVIAVINQPATFSAPVSKTDVTCFGLCNGTATATPSGGTAPYIYSWQTTPTQSTQTATGLCPGNYNITITDNNGCVITPNTSISEPAVLTTSITNTGATCGNNDGTATATPAGGNVPYTYLWTSGSTAQSPTGLVLGNYTVTVTDSKGCTTSATTTITATTNGQEICMVTVDSTSTKNVIVWEKPIATNIDSFRIYRDIASVYTYVGGVSYSALSTFTDSGAGINPNFTSYMYKMSALDVCGAESALSSFHKTIHNAVSAALPSGYALDWDDYLGFSVAQYRILRDTNNLDNWVPMDSVPFSITAYTDPIQWDSVGYMIEIDHPGGCNITIKNPVPMATNLNSSRSNVYRVQDSTTVNVNEMADGFIANVYPNPSSGIFTIQMADGRGKRADVKVYNVLGECVHKSLLLTPKSLIDLRNQSKGVYYLQISTNDKVITMKIIIE
ncbi:MAG: T9SS type A sorting domain-containing protein [Bacteroidetes bacterium]|nr:T9SS type A sorting domain-containing protein [Bacteroidota bacterium]